MAKTIMVVDDSASVRTAVGIALREGGYQVIEKREGQVAGAKAWVVKPFKPEQMLSAVQRLCLP